MYKTTRVLLVGVLGGCAPELPRDESIEALGGVAAVQPRVDERTADPEAWFDDFRVSLSGVRFDGRVPGDGEVWDGEVKVDGFVPLSLDEVTVEIHGKWKDVELLDSGTVFDGHTDLVAGVDLMGAAAGTVWLDFSGELRVDDGESVGRLDFAVHAEVSGTDVLLDATANGHDVTNEFVDGEFSSFLFFF